MNVSRPLNSEVLPAVSNLRRLARAALAVAIIWFAVVIAIGLPAEAHFLIYGLAGSAVIVLVSTPTLTTAWALVIGALLLIPVRIGQWEGLVAGMRIEPALPLAYLGLAAMVLLAVRGIGQTVPKVAFTGAIGIPTFIFLTEPFHTLVIRATPRTVDPALLRLDLLLFGDVTFATGRLLARHPWLEVASVWSYVSLALVAAVLYSLAMRGRTGSVRHSELLWTWSVAAILAAICYPLVPAVGPRWVFATWPWGLPFPIEGTTVPTADVPRNAMPSMHAAWALLVCWGAREAPRPLWLFLTPWLALTLIATLGAGGHYLIDLVAALPVVAAAGWAGRQLSGSRHRDHAA